MFKEIYEQRELINTATNALRVYYRHCKTKIDNARKRNDHTLAYHWQGERNRCAQLITAMNDAIVEEAQR